MNLKQILFKNLFFYIEWKILFLFLQFETWNCSVGNFLGGRGRPPKRNKPKYVESDDDPEEEEKPVKRRRRATRAVDPDEAGSSESSPPARRPSRAAAAKRNSYGKILCYCPLSPFLFFILSIIRNYLFWHKYYLLLFSCILLNLFIYISFDSLKVYFHVKVHI